MFNCIYNTTCLHIVVYTIFPLNLLRVVTFTIRITYSNVSRFPRTISKKKKKKFLKYVSVRKILPFHTSMRRASHMEYASIFSLYPSLSLPDSWRSYWSNIPWEKALKARKQPSATKLVVVNFHVLRFFILLLTLISLTRVRAYQSLLYIHGRWMFYIYIRRIRFFFLNYKHSHSRWALFNRLLGDSGFIMMRSLNWDFDIHWPI